MTPNLRDDLPSDAGTSTPHVEPFTPGDNAYAEPSPHDGDNPEQYEPIPADWYPDDVHSQLQRQRANAHNESTHIVRWIDCNDCGRTACYYGPVDNCPDPDGWRCDRCD